MGRIAFNLGPWRPESDAASVKRHGDGGAELPCSTADIARGLRPAELGPTHKKRWTGLPMTIVEHSMASADGVGGTLSEEITIKDAFLRAGIEFGPPSVRMCLTDLGNLSTVGEQG